MPVKTVPLIDKSQIHNDVDIGIQSVCTKIVTLRIKSYVYVCPTDIRTILSQTAWIYEPLSKRAKHALIRVSSIKTTAINSLA